MSEQAEATNVQDEQAEEAPPEAPPLPAANTARAGIGAAMAKPAIARATRTSASSSEDKWKWWYFVAGGVFLLGYAVWKYVDLSQAETTGDSGFGRVHGSDRTLYMIFGKWGVVVGTVLAGLVAIAVGIWQFKHQHRRSE